jgi:hypothetical protein
MDDHLQKPKGSRIAYSIFYRAPINLHLVWKTPNIRSHCNAVLGPGCWLKNCDRSTVITKGGPSGNVPRSSVTLTMLRGPPFEIVLCRAKNVVRFVLEDQYGMRVVSDPIL